MKLNNLLTEMVLRKLPCGLFLRKLPLAKDKPIGEGRLVVSKQSPTEVATGWSRRSWGTNACQTLRMSTWEARLNGNSSDFQAISFYVLFSIVECRFHLFDSTWHPGLLLPEELALAIFVQALPLCGLPGLNWYGFMNRISRQRNMSCFSLHFIRVLQNKYK